MSKYAKAIAGALTVLVTFAVGELGFNLDENLTAAIGTLLTALVVWRIPNTPLTPSDEPVKIERSLRG